MIGNLLLLLACAGQAYLVINGKARKLDEFYEHWTVVSDNALGGSLVMTASTLPDGMCKRQCLESDGCEGVSLCVGASQTSCFLWARDGSLQTPDCAGGNQTLWAYSSGGWEIATLVNQEGYQAVTLPFAVRVQGFHRRVWLGPNASVRLSPPACCELQDEQLQPCIPRGVCDGKSRNHELSLWPWPDGPTWSNISFRFSEVSGIVEVRYQAAPCGSGEELLVLLLTLHSTGRFVIDYHGLSACNITATEGQVGIVGPVPGLDTFFSVLNSTQLGVNTSLTFCPFPETLCAYPSNIHDGTTIHLLRDPSELEPDWTCLEEASATDTLLCRFSSNEPGTFWDSKMTVNASTGTLVCQAPALPAIANTTTIDLRLSVAFANATVPTLGRKSALDGSDGLSLLYAFSPSAEDESTDIWTNGLCERCWGRQNGSSLANHHTTYPHLPYCKRDCTDTWGGSAVLDTCRTCSGGSSNHTADADLGCYGQCVPESPTFTPNGPECTHTPVKISTRVTVPVQYALAPVVGYKVAMSVILLVAMICFVVVVCCPRERPAGGDRRLIQLQRISTSRSSPSSAAPYAPPAASTSGAPNPSNSQAEQALG